VVSRSRAIWAAGLLAAAVCAWVLVLRSDRQEAGVGVAERSATAADRQATLPRITLDRLEADRPEATVGRRNLFEFGRPATPVRPEAPVPGPAPTPPPAKTGDGGSGTLPTRMARLGSRAADLSRLSYIGSVRSQQGLEVAVLLTEDAEVLTGRVGDTVANRVKIVSIGLESVDVQGVGSDRVQRLPLKEKP
jgi:hypothetical protein